MPVAPAWHSSTHREQLLALLGVKNEWERAWLNGPRPGITVLALIRGPSHHRSLNR